MKTDKKDKKNKTDYLLRDIPTSTWRALQIALLKESEITGEKITIKAFFVSCIEKKVVELNK